MRADNLSPKVKALYDAVREIMIEDIDVKEIKVSDITSRAGIGKGTAYEYFKNKEEIIGSALLYHMDLICSQIMARICRLKDFSEVIQFILCSMDEEIQKRDCLIKFVHLMSDNGSVSKFIRQKINQEKPDVCMPENLIEKMIQIGIANGDIKDKLPHSYMNMVIASKLIVYAIYITYEKEEKKCSKAQMHELICDSLLKEFN